MPTPAPNIDKRAYDQFVAETEALVNAFTNWQPRVDGQPEAGQAMIRIFARLAELISQRLNQVPDKNFLAFLDLIGTQILPPQPARVPLTFQLAAGSPADARVPARTKAAALPAEEETAEVIFETDRDLIVTPARLSAVFVRNPDTDEYGDYSQAAAGLVDQGYAAFEGDTPLEHSLYLAHDDFFTLSEPKSITLDINSPDAALLNALPVTWSIRDESGWQPLPVSASQLVSSTWQVSFANLPVPGGHEIDDLAAAWLRARLDIPLPRGQVTVIDAAQARQEIHRMDLAPVIADAGGNLLATGSPFYPFDLSSTPLIFWLNVEEAFVRGGATVTISVTLAEIGQASSTLALRWQFWNGSSPQELGQSGADDPSLGVTVFAFRDGTQAFTQDGEISFQAPLAWQDEVVAGRRGHWLQVAVIQGDYGSGPTGQPPQIQTIRAAYRWELPRIDQITATVQAARAGLIPEFSFFNLLALDLSKDFYPFGEKPRLGDALYFTLHRELARPHTQVTVAVTLSNPNPTGADPSGQPPPVPVKASDDLQLVWEIWNGQQWQEVGGSSPTDPALPGSSAGFNDSTRALTAAGQIALTLPDRIEQGAVNGETGYWFRARIRQGNYGVEASYQPDNQGGYTLVPATFAPPMISALGVDYDYQASDSLKACKTCNDFTCFDQTVTAGAAGALFLPFVPTAETRPALYLGFDRPFANRPVSLYVQVEPPLYEAARAAANRVAAAAAPAQVVWQYAGRSGWSRLGVQDETNAFAERGLVTFIGPPDFTARTEFGAEYYWLRARWESGDFMAAPRLRRVLTNTIWASQTATFQNEILGSSTGQPDQVFRTSKAPVLPGVQIEVREPELPSIAERAAIEALAGDEAIATVLDAANRPVEIWVRWHQTPDFYGSGPRDRHYVVDHLAGAIYFGDGQRGLVPPQGRSNIRAALYRTGGGVRGNRLAGSITQLKSAVPYVDGVTNHEPAAAGAEQETLGQVKERGPKRLRHRHRSVTAQDFEDLAYEASPHVARARAIPARDGRSAGRVELIIVPRTAVAQPIPSLDLLNRVENYILARVAPAVTLWLLGPEWSQVTVQAQLRPISFAAAERLAETATLALHRFLHPLTGGLDGGGWDFGRKPHPSDLYRLLESTEGVDHVRRLDVIEAPMIQTLSPEQMRRLLIYSGTHDISLVSPEAGG